MEPTDIAQLVHKVVSIMAQSATPDPNQKMVPRSQSTVLMDPQDSAHPVHKSASIMAQSAMKSA